MRRIITIFFAIILLPCMLAAYRMDFSEDGAVEKRKGDGFVELQGKEGETLLRYSDKTQASFKDGTVITKFRDGSRDIKAPDGTVIRVEYDSSVKYTYRNGRIVEISMDGKTPYGMDVDERRNVLRKGKTTVEIIYSKMQSDDSPDKYLESYYREFNDTMLVALDGGRIPEGTYRVVISNCRFCKTGYCRRKNIVEIAVTGSMNDADSGKFSFQHDNILSENGRRDIVNRTVDEMVKGWSPAE